MEPLPGYAHAQTIRAVAMRLSPARTFALVLRGLGYGSHHDGLECAEPVESAGWAPPLALVSAGALLGTAAASALSLAGSEHGVALFWLSVAVVILPLSFRIVWPRASRTERIWLVNILGLSLYLIGIIPSPIAFWGHDEYLHWSTTIDILEHHHLFTANSLLPVSPSYPGLEIVTSALVQLTGLSVHQCAVILVGLLRILSTSLLFLIFEAVSASSWVGGLATLVYMANSNFYSFLATFSYETIALDFLLAVVLIAALVARGTGSGRWRLVCISAPVFFALAASHHLTSWAGVLILGSASAAAFVRGDRSAAWATATIAGAAFLFISVWKSTSGGGVNEYVGDIFGRSLNDFANFLTGTHAARALFVSESGVHQPAGYRTVAVLSVALVAAGLVVGFFRSLGLPGAAKPRQAGRSDVLFGMRDNAWAIILTLSSFGFPVSIAMRLTSGGWEFGNRMSAFAFLGVGLVVAVGAAKVLVTPRASLLRTAVVSLCLSIILVGGIISDLPAGPVAVPYRPAADGSSIEPMGIATAQWTRDWLGRGRRFGSDRVNRLLLATYGVQRIVTLEQDGEEPDQVMFDPVFSLEDRRLVQATATNFLLIDVRLQRELPLFGYYFQSAEDPELHKSPPLSLDLLKFDELLRVGRIYDNGYEVIYDVGNLIENAPRNTVQLIDNTKLNALEEGRTYKAGGRVSFDPALPGPPVVKDRDPANDAQPMQPMRIEVGAETRRRLDRRAVVNEDAGVLRHAK